VIKAGVVRAPCDTSPAATLESASRVLLMTDFNTDSMTAAGGAMDGWGVEGAGGLVVLTVVDVSYIAISPSSPSSISSETALALKGIMLVSRALRGIEFDVYGCDDNVLG
jgi:hypothetical protein